MIKLNNRGDAYYSVVGVVRFRDGTEAETGLAGGGWLTLYEVFGTEFNPDILGYRQVTAVNPRTGARRVLAEQGTGLLSPNGDGDWLAALPGGQVFGTIPVPPDRWNGLIEFATWGDGDGLIPVVNGSNTDISITHPTGHFETFHTQGFQGVTLLSPIDAAFVSTTDWLMRTLQGQRFKQVPGASGATAGRDYFEFMGVPWIAYYVPDGKWVCHQAIATDDPAELKGYWYEGGNTGDRVPVDGKLVLAWTTGPAESYMERQYRVIDPAVEPPQSLVIPVPPIVIPDTPGMSRHPAAVVPFKLVPGGGVTPYSSILVSQPFRSDLTLHAPWYAGIPPESFSGAIEGIYVEVSHGVDAPALLAAAERLNCRIAALTDGSMPAMVPDWLRPFDMVLLECYRWALSLAAAVEIWQWNMADLLTRWPGDIGVVPQFYRMGGVPGIYSEQDAIDAAAACVNLIVPMSDRIKVVAPFSFDRANGIIANPGLMALYQQVVKQQGEPVFTPISPVPPVSADTDLAAYLLQE